MRDPLVILPPHSAALLPERGAGFVDFRGRQTQHAVESPAEPSSGSVVGLNPPLDALSWLLSLSLAFSPCRPAHHRAEPLCAAPPAKSDAPPASSLELKPREAQRGIVGASPTNFRANPLPSRSNLASSCRLPRRRRPPSAPHRRAASLLLLRPSEALGELPHTPVHLLRMPLSLRPVVGAWVRDDRLPPRHSSRRRPCHRRVLQRWAAPFGPRALVEAIAALTRVCCVAVRLRRVKAVPPPDWFCPSPPIAVLRPSPASTCTPTVTTCSCWCCCHLRPGRSDRRSPPATSPEPPAWGTGRGSILTRVKPTGPTVSLSG